MRSVARSVGAKRRVARDSEAPDADAAVRTRRARGEERSVGRGATRHETRHARDATRAGCAVRSAMRASIGALEEVARRRHRHQDIFATTRQLASSSGAVNSLSHSQALQSQRRH